MDKKKILILPGDGIGPEAVDEVKKIIDFSKKLEIYKNPKELISISLGSEETTLFILFTKTSS